MKKLKNLSTPTLVVIIFVGGFLVYANSLSNNFVWDDEEQVVNNPFIKSWKNLPAIFSGSTFSTGGAGLSGWYYKPLMSFWFMVNFSLWKLKPFGFHLFQILLHLINSSLVFLIFKELFKGFGGNKAKIGSLFASLIFAIHPANSESVVYIAASQEVLYTFFLLLIFWLFIRSKTAPSLKQIFPPIFFFFALLSKESAVIAIPLVSLYLFLFDKKKLLPWLRDSVLVFLFYLYLRIFVAKIPLEAPSLSPISQATLKQRLLTIPFEISSYIRLIFFPRILSISQHQVIKSPIDPRFLVSLPVVVLFLGGTIISVLKSKNKLAWFFLFWFLFSLSLVLNIFPLDMTIAERWLYFPLIGFLGLTLFFVLKNLNKTPSFLLLPSLLIVILLFSLRTFVRNFSWKNGLTLFSHDISYSQNSFDLENNLGVELFRAGKIKEAKPHFEHSIKLQPKWWTSYNNLGVVYEREGNLQKARELYEKSIENGDYYLAYENLGASLLKTAPPQETISFLEEALEKLPFNAQLWSTLALTYLKDNRPEKAFLAAKKAFNLVPTKENWLLLQTISKDQIH